jgi:hypothetical protein
MRQRRNDADDESRSISPAARAAVRERDNGGCRMCGRPAWDVHHIFFRSQGGRRDLGEGKVLHLPGNLILLCHHPCHLSRAHGPEAGIWRELFVQLLDDPSLAGTTAMQLRRWL